MAAICWWTEEQVRKLQKRLKVDETSILNRPTWEALSVELKMEIQPTPPALTNFFIVKNHLLYLGERQVDWKPTPNISGNLIKPELIVIHYTGDNSLQGALSWLTTRGSGVSAHLVVAKTGQVWQLAPFNRRAWHAGASTWKGRGDCNSWSVGIENVGLGDEWPEAQVQANVKIVEALRAAYPIYDVVGHSDVAPGRKSDPGTHFPWDRVSPDHGRA